MSIHAFGGAVLALFLLAAAPAEATGPTCHTCGDAIQGRYTVYEELGWDICSSCGSAPACQGCGLPQAGRLQGADGYCTRCRASADRCAACGLPILARGWTVSGVAGKFCERCHAEAPQCTSCGAPARDGRIVGARLVCGTCRPRVLDDPSACRALYARMAQRARERLGLDLDELPQLVIDGPDALAQRGVEVSEEARVCGLYVRDADGDARIHLLSHLTEARTAAVLAHEIAHAWQAQVCPDDQGVRVREGFAEWVAWKLLDGMEGTDSERGLIEARTDDYGVGFRLFVGLEERHGAEHAIWYASAARLR